MGEQELAQLIAENAHHTWVLITSILGSIFAAILVVCGIIAFFATLFDSEDRAWNQEKNQYEFRDKWVGLGMFIRAGFFAALTGGFAFFFVLCVQWASTADVTKSQSGKEINRYNERQDLLVQESGDRTSDPELRAAWAEFMRERNESNSLGIDITNVTPPTPDE